MDNGLQFSIELNKHPKNENKYRYIIQNKQNGKKSLISFFKSYIHGKCLSWYENGTLESKSFWDMNRPRGTHYFYYLDGSIRYRIQYFKHSHNPVLEEYEQSTGRPLMTFRAPFVPQKPVFEYNRFATSLPFISRIEARNTEDHLVDLKQFANDGTVVSRVRETFNGVLERVEVERFQLGLKHGEKTSIDSKKKTLTICHYISDLLHGYSQTFDLSSGSLLESKKYVLGVQWGPYLRYRLEPSHQLEESSFYYLDRKHGVEFQYQSDVIVGSGNYLYGVKHGWFYEFDPDTHLLKKLQLFVHGRCLLTVL